jgi:hypothetical protein
MGIATGRPRGRPKGAKNKRTVEREADMREMAARIGNAVGGAFEGDALAYLTSIYKDPAKPENVRMDAAKAAIRYERVALAPVEQAPETDFVPLAERLTRYVGTDAWERRPTRLLEWEKAGVQEEPALANLPVPRNYGASGPDGVPTSSVGEPNLSPSRSHGSVEGKVRYSEQCVGCSCDPGSAEELECLGHH